jgi:hypothetical protein
MLCRNCEARFSDLDTYGWKILITTMGNASCLHQPYLFLVQKPDQFFMPLVPKEWSGPEFNYLRHLKQREMKLYPGAH